MLPSLPYYNDQELLSQIVAGDADAFRILFSKYYSKVYAFSLKVTRSAPIAEDITQEVFLKIWVNREQMAAVENPEAWIITVARNLSFNQLKRIAAERCSLERQINAEGPVIPMIDQLLEQKDLLSKLRQVSAELTPRQQLIYRLSKEKGLRKKEIAETLNISENTVKVHLTHALRKIRQLMERYASAGSLTLFLLRNLF